MIGTRLKAKPVIRSAADEVPSKMALIHTTITAIPIVISVLLSERSNIPMIVSVIRFVMFARLREMFSIPMITTVIIFVISAVQYALLNTISTVITVPYAVKKFTVFWWQATMSHQKMLPMYWVTVQSAMMHLPIH